MKTEIIHVWVPPTTKIPLPYWGTIGVTEATRMVYLSRGFILRTTDEFDDLGDQAPTLWEVYEAMVLVSCAHLSDPERPALCRSCGVKCDRDGVEK